MNSALSVLLALSALAVGALTVLRHRSTTTPGPVARLGGAKLPRPARLPRGERLPNPPMRRPWPLAAIAALLGGAVWMWPTPDQPSEFASAVLTGPRGPGCVRLAVLSDTSGSMGEYLPAGHAAVSSVLAWSPANLREDDEVIVVAFAGDAVTTLPAVSVANSVGVSPSTRAPRDGQGTWLLPALAELEAAPASRCRTVVALVSDGEIAEDNPQRMLAALQAARVDKVLLLLPSEDLRVPDTWRAVLPYAPTSAFDGLDADATSLALGRVLADATGQQLQRR